MTKMIFPNHETTAILSFQIFQITFIAHFPHVKKKKKKEGKKSCLFLREKLKEKVLLEKS